MMALLLYLPLLTQILFFCLFSVFLMIVIRYSKQKKYVSVCIIGILSLASGMMTYRFYTEHTNNYGVVMAESTVYIGPGTLYHSLGSVPQGTKVLLCKQQGEWNQVMWNNKKGWMLNKDLETI